MDLITQILKGEMDRRLKAYVTHSEEMTTRIPASHIPIWRSFVSRRPNWVDNTEDELPDDSLDIFYRVDPDDWVYDTYTENSEISFDSLEAILANPVVKSHLDIASKMAEGQTFSFDTDRKTSCHQDVMQYASFLLIDGAPSYMYEPAERYRESSTATENAMRAIRSLALLRRSQYTPEKVLEMAKVETMDDYVRRVIFPFLSASMAWNYMDYHGQLHELDDVFVNRVYHIATCPKPEWNPPPSPEFKRWCEEDCRQQWEKMGMGKKILNSLNCSLPPSPEPPASASASAPARPSPRTTPTTTSGGGRGQGRGGQGHRQEPMPNYTKGTPIPPLRIIEGTPPMIMRRRDARPSVEGESEVLMQDAIYSKNIYERGKKKYSVRTIVEELPRLLQIPAKRDAYMQCEFPVFERPIKEMPIFFRKQFCEVLTSLCLELATKTTFEERHATVQKYHGFQREDETLEQYYFNFQNNVWDAVANLVGGLL